MFFIRQLKPLQVSLLKDIFLVSVYDVISEKDFRAHTFYSDKCKLYFICRKRSPNYNLGYGNSQNTGCSHFNHLLILKLMHNLKWGLGFNSVMLEMMTQDTRFPKWLMKRLIEKHPVCFIIFHWFLNGENLSTDILVFSWNLSDVK